MLESITVPAPRSGQNVVTPSPPSDIVLKRIVISHPLLGSSERWMCVPDPVPFRLDPLPVVSSYVLQKKLFSTRASAMYEPLWMLKLIAAVLPRHSWKREFLISRPSTPMT